MGFFSKTVDLRSRKAMVDFLMSHHRYNTMNSWNRSSSYSHRVKIPYLGLSNAQADEAYDFISADDSLWGDELGFIIDNFTAEMGGGYTIGTNGRSGGYLVLYQSRYEPTGYKSYCRTCWQKNYATIAESGHNSCGACKAAGDKGRVDYPTTHTRLSTYGGRSIGQDEEFHPDEWSFSALKERVKLVQRFDLACDDIRDRFIDMIGLYDVVEEVVMVPTKRRVLVEAHA